MTYEKRIAQELRTQQEALERAHWDYCAGDIDEQEYRMRCAYLTQQIKIYQEILEQPAEKDCA